MLVSIKATVRDAFWRNEPNCDLGEEATMIAASKPNCIAAHIPFFICGGDDNSQQESERAKSVWSNSNEAQSV
jgi:hypothetical protein